MTIRQVLDTFDGYISYNTLSNESLDIEIVDNQLVPFTAWSTTHVYFPLADGSIGRVPRSPCNEIVQPLGGDS